MHIYNKIVRMSLFGFLLKLSAFKCSEKKKLSINVLLNVNKMFKIYTFMFYFVN